MVREATFNGVDALIQAAWMDKDLSKRSVRRRDLADSSISPLRILLVDDAQFILDRLARSLSQLTDVDLVGMCHDAVQAIRQIDQLSPHLVILDISLRQSNGWDVLSHVMDNAIPAQVFIFSNNASTPSRQRFLNGGASKFFDKSSEFPALRAQVADLASQHRSKQQFP